MKKGFDFIKSFASLLILSMILICVSSCSNFLAGSGLKDDLEGEINYAKAGLVNVSVGKENPDDTNTIFPAGKVTDKKIGYAFDISYTSSSTYVFKEWLAVDKDGNLFQTKDVEFGSTTSPDTTVTVKTSKEVKIQAVSTLVPRVTGHFPEYSSSGVPASTVIYVNFNTPMKDANLDYSSIKVTDLDDNDISQYFQLPKKTDDDCKVFTIQPNTMDLINSGFFKKEAGYIDVKFSFTEKIITNSIGLYQDEQTEFKLRLTNNLETNPPAILGYDISKNGTPLLKKTLSEFDDSENSTDFITNLANKISVDIECIDLDSGVAGIIIEETKTNYSDGMIIEVAYKETFQTVIYLTLENHTIVDDYSYVMNFDYDLKSKGNGAVLIKLYVVDYCGNKSEPKEFSLIVHKDYSLSDIKLTNGPSKTIGGKLYTGTEYLDKVNINPDTTGMNKTYQFQAIGEGVANVGNHKIAVPTQDAGDYLNDWDYRSYYYASNGRYTNKYFDLYESYISNYEEYEEFDLEEVQETLNKVYVTSDEKIYKNYTASFLEKVTVEYGYLENRDKTLDLIKNDYSIFTGSLVDDNNNPIKDLSNYSIKVEAKSVNGETYSKVYHFPGTNYYSEVNVVDDINNGKRWSVAYYDNTGSIDRTYCFFKFDPDYVSVPDVWIDADTIQKSENPMPYGGSYRLGGVSTDTNGNAMYHETMLGYCLLAAAGNSISSQAWSTPYFHSEGVCYRSLAAYDGLLANLSEEINYKGKFNTRVDFSRFGVHYSQDFPNIYNWDHRCYGDIIAGKLSNTNYPKGPQLDFQKDYVTSIKIESAGVNSNTYKITLEFDPSFWTTTNYDLIRFDVKKYETIYTVSDWAYFYTMFHQAINYKNSATEACLKGSTKVELLIPDGLYFQGSDVTFYYQLKGMYNGIIQDVLNTSISSAYGYSFNKYNYDNYPPLAHWDALTIKNVDMNEIDCTQPEITTESTFKITNTEITDEVTGETQTVKNSSIVIGKLKDSQSGLSSCKIYHQDLLLEKFDFVENDIYPNEKNIEISYLPKPNETELRYTVYVYDRNGNNCESTSTVSFANKPLTNSNTKTAEADRCTFAKMAANDGYLTVLSNKPVVCELLVAPYGIEDCEGATVADFQLYNMSYDEQTLALSTEQQIDFYTYDTSEIPEGYCYMAVAYFTDGTIMNSKIMQK